MTHRRIAMLVPCVGVAAVAGLTVAVAQDAPSKKPTMPPPDRTEYDRYLWELAHHPDTLAAFEGFLNDGKEPNPWAWHIDRVNGVYCSKVLFDKFLLQLLEEQHGNKARAELLRRQAIAKKFDHTLWELFQAIAVYNRDVLLSREQKQALLTIEEAKPRRNRNDKLLEQLKLPPLSTKEWGDLPLARSKPADSKKP